MICAGSLVGWLELLISRMHEDKIALFLHAAMCGRRGTADDNITPLAIVDCTACRAWC